jgi:ParB family chromosome partitioning protein
LSNARSEKPAAAAGRRGLGRGLEVLIGGAAERELTHLPVETVHASPRQPRRRFDSEATGALAESVRAQGVVQPVLVRPRASGGFELIAGERRWRAAREAGLPTVPALIREADDRDSLLLGLVENVAREQLSPVEEARAYAVLLDEFGLSLGDVAARVGRSKPAVSNRVRLLELPDDVLAIAERARGAAERLVGTSVHLAAGRLEIPFADEHELAEIAEAFERAL